MLIPSLLSETIPLPELRRQDTKNRQNSIDDIDPFVKQEFEIKMKRHFMQGMELYKEMLDASIAKECARFVLPLAVPTKLYMTGSLAHGFIILICVLLTALRKNTWRLLNFVKQHFICQFPTIAEALEWCPDGDCGCSEDIDYADCLQPSLRID